MVSQVVFENEVIFSALGVEYVRINIHSLTTSFGTPVWLLIYSQSQEFFLHDRVYVYRERSEKGENTGHVSSSSSSRLDQGLLSKYSRLQFTRTHQNRTTEVCQNTLMSHFYYNIQMIVSEFQHMDPPWPAAVVQALCAGIKVWVFSSLSTNWESLVPQPSWVLLLTWFNHLLMVQVITPRHKAQITSDCFLDFTPQRPLWGSSRICKLCKSLKTVCSGWMM